MMSLVLMILSSVAAPSAPALGVSSAVSARPRALSDVAKERRLGVQGVPGGTFSVAGAEGMPVLLLPVYGEGGSFEEVDRNDAAHRPAPATTYGVYDPYFSNYWPNGYGGTRTHFGARHTAPAPSVARAPAPVTRAPAAAPRAAPRVSISRRSR